MARPKRSPSSPALPPRPTPNLGSMSREAKIELLEALEERARRSKLAKSAYKPNDGQRVIHFSRSKTRLVVSGNGMGKTALAVHEAVWGAQGYNPLSKEYLPVPRRVVVLLDKPGKVEDKWLPELKKWFDVEKWGFHKHGKPHVSEISFPNGSQIIFMSHEQDPLTFESFELDDLVADEPPPRSVYIGLLRGMRNKDANGRVLLIGTPLSGAWLRKDIYEPWSRGELPDTECFRFNTDVNKANLPEGYIEWFSSKLSEKERQIRLEGQFFDLDGLALSHLIQKDKHYLNSYEYNPSYPCVVSIDPHPSKKHVALLLTADKIGPVALKELSAKLTPRDFAKELKKWYSGHKVIDIVCDSLGSSEMTGGEGFKSFIQVLNEEGIRCRATTYDDKSDEDWIARIQDVLMVPTEPNSFGECVPKLRVVKSCTGLINDLETVEWTRRRGSEDFKPTLSIESKDYLATLKYGLASGLSVNKAKDKVYYRNDDVYGFQPRHRRVMRYSR